MLQQSKQDLLCPKTGEIPAQGGTVNQVLGFTAGDEQALSRAIN